MAISKIRMRWSLRTLMIVVALCGVGLLIYRVNVERAPVYRLIRQLRTGNPAARLAAASQIGLIGPRASFAGGALTSALDDPDPGVRTQAMYALVMLGGKSRRLLRALVAEIENPPTRRSGLRIGAPPGDDPVTALETIRPPAAVIIPMLADALESPNARVHRQALRALCAVASRSDPSSVELAAVLSRELDDPSFDNRKQAAESLADLDPRLQQDAVARLSEDLRNLDSARSFEASMLLPLFVEGTAAALSTLVDQVRGDDEIHRLIALSLLGEYRELAAPAAPALIQVVTERDADRRIHLDLRMYWWKSLNASGAGDLFQEQFPAQQAPGDTSAIKLGVRALIGMGAAVERRAIHDLIAVVRDPDRDDCQKRGAIVALGEFGPRTGEAIPALLGVIRSGGRSADRAPSPDDDEDAEWLGMLATEALEEIHSEANPDLVAMLAGLLEDGDAKVRSVAAIALDRLGPKARAAVPALVKALKESTDPVVRRWAASALGRIEAPDIRAVLPPLMAALDDPDRLVRNRAAQAIGPFGPAAREAVPKIVRLLWESGWESELAIALGQIGPDAATAAPPLVAFLNGARPPSDKGLEGALDRIMPRTPGATIAGSIAALKARAGDPAGRARAAYELGWLIAGPPGSAEGAAALGEALGDPDPRVRRMAAAVLGRSGPGAATAGPALIRATRDPDESVRKLAAATLRRAADVPRAIPALADLMKDPSVEVRRWTAGVLGSLGGRATSATPALIAALQGQDTSTRASILTALGRVDASGKEVIPLLIQALDDPAEEIRAAAVGSLGHFIGAHRNVVMPSLLKTLGDPSWEVRYHVSGTLGLSRPTPLVVPALIEALSQGEPLARATAADALGRINYAGPQNPQTIQRAVEALTPALADQDPRVRESAARALAFFRGAAEPSERELRAAMDDPSRRVRDEASAALRAIAEDRARR